jgi:hypothetical protein
MAKAKARSATSRKTKIAFVAAIFVGFASPSFAQYYGPYASYGYGPYASYGYGTYGSYRRGHSPYGYGAYGSVGPVYGQYSVNEPYYFPPTGYYGAYGYDYTRYTIPAEQTHWFERNPPYFNN